ncbi:MAG: AmmeMemoRadiSam system protein B [Patescibacteria group bacterium]|nr:AmmeMemoRadiSam system protein B [Patescibacteria group bacterium]
MLRKRAVPSDINASSPETAGRVRLAAVAGSFYPGEPKDLSATVDRYLANATLPQARGQILALVVPHAGYQYSGQVAAYGYKLLVGQHIDTVVLVGSSHTARFPGASIYAEGSWRTPLGDVAVDRDVALAIISAAPRVRFIESVHVEEHSLEVQLPFLQKTLKNFNIVPIMLGNDGETDYQMLAQAIITAVKGKNVLVVASSDLSHYPGYRDAKTVDAKTIQGILGGDCQKLEKVIADLETQEIPAAATFACGEDAIKTVMLVAQAAGADEIKLLNAANSGDVSGDRSRVVGYAAIGFFGPRRGNALSTAEQQRLLGIAKTSVETYVRTGKTTKLNVTEPALQAHVGAFVTLKENGRLRGCIGRFSPTDAPLWQVVSQMAMAAATEDQRFLPVEPAELGALRYEISVLGDNEKISDASRIQLGKHGVMVRAGARSGVFLPQVATDTQWDLDRFLGELCAQKAGLAYDCWKDSRTELFVFTAQVFGDE